MTYEDYFEEQLLERAWEKNAQEDSNPVLCRMPPTLFSSLALRGLDPDAMYELPKPDRGGVKWNSLPSLAIGCCGDEAMVIDHDGRHRAMYLIAQGIEEMLVLLYLNVDPIYMPNRVINEDRNRLHHLPSNVVQAKNNKVSNGFETEEWSDTGLDKGYTRSFYRAYFNSGGQYIC